MSVREIKACPADKPRIIKDQSLWSDTALEIWCMTQTGILLQRQRRIIWLAFVNPCDEVKSIFDLEIFAKPDQRKIVAWGCNSPNTQVLLIMSFSKTPAYKTYIIKTLSKFTANYRNKFELRGRGPRAPH